MDVSIEVLKFYLGLINLGLALYMLPIVYSAMRTNHVHSFSKTMAVMLAAGLLFCLLQAVQVFRLFSGPALDMVEPLAVMALLLLLITAALETKKDMLAHDHLVRRRLRGRLSDVE